MSDTKIIINTTKEFKDKAKALAKEKNITMASLFKTLLDDAIQNRKDK